MRRQQHRQLRVLEDFAAHQVGQRHFGGRNQVALGLANLRAEQVLLELRQLAGALHAVGVDQQRHVAFGVAVFAGVQVEHELPKRAMQPGQLAAHDGEARSGKFRASLRVEPVVPFAERDMVLDRKIETAGRAHALEFQVLRFVPAGRHRLMQKIRDAQRDRFQFRAEQVEPGLGCLQLVGESGDLGHERGGILALALCVADRLRADIAKILQFLGARLELLALGLERLHGAYVQVKSAGSLEAGGGLGQLAAQEGGIEHRCIPKMKRDAELSPRPAICCNEKPLNEPDDPATRPWRCRRASSRAPVPAGCPW